MKYKIENLTQFGIIDDLPAYDLPDNAFSSGQNIAFRDGKVQKAKGYQQVFGTPIESLTLTLTSYAPTVSQ
jgi:hypothetical protein